MIRFRNPGTQYDTQIQLIKIMYENLKEQESFTLGDMAQSFVQERLMTAHGYAGDKALELSKNDKESLNSSLMNAKMYAEIFRMLGWITPFGKRAYPMKFTYIGIHVATAKGDVRKLYEQCVFGINNPNELTDRLSYDENVRFFKCALRSLIDLNGIMYKHELSLGPMSVNDIDEEEYQSMILKIKQIRGKYSRLTKAFSDLAQSLNMSETSVDNCTRIPVAFLKTCGLVETISTNELYSDRKLSCLKLTEYGNEVYASLKDLKDLRLEDFNQCNEEQQSALIRLGIYSMLSRSGFDISPVAEQLEEDELLCENILQGRELLFSPYQTIRNEMIDKAMGFEKDEKPIQINDKFLKEINHVESDGVIEQMITNIELNVEAEAGLSLLNFDEDMKLLNEINTLVGEGKTVIEITDFLFEKYKNAKQAEFYPLIATLFKLSGYNCSFSRPGDNASRWDAIIEDSHSSIPIEIKSPTEEERISIKAIRQAVENKIILLSRETYKTSREVTTLAVGYLPPNDRAEVSRLIRDFKSTFNIKVGVIDLQTLLQIALNILINGKGFERKKLFDLEGILHADFR